MFGVEGGCFGVEGEVFWGGRGGVLGEIWVFLVGFGCV